jgi:hypothetical protein
VEEVFTGFWLGGPKARDHWEDLGVGGRITLRCTLGREWSMGRTGFGWFGIGSDGRLLWTQRWTFGFHKESRIFFDKLTISSSAPWNKLYKASDCEVRRVPLKLMNPYSCSCNLLTEHHATKAYLGWRHSSTHSSTSALDGGKWSASRPSCFALREKAPVIHWIGRWVGSRAGLDAVVRRKIPSPYRDSNTRSSSP